MIQRLAIPAIAGCALLAAGCGGDNTGIGKIPAASAAPGSSWDSIRTLPDWSGVWAYSMPGTQQLQVARGVLLNEDGIPLTAAYARARAAAKAEHAQNNMSKCLPAGVPGVMLHGMLHEYLFTPGRVTMLVEDGEVRRIYTDGRAHRSLDEMQGSYMGDSIGHWEGDTLVVDTIGFPNGTVFQNYGGLATRNSHLVERIRKVDSQHMRIDSEMTDPALFTSPYRFSRLYQRTDIPLNEPVCAQNNRDTGDTIDLTPPPEE